MRALLIHGRWIDKILAGEKTWEIRPGCSTIRVHPLDKLGTGCA